MRDLSSADRRALELLQRFSLTTARIIYGMPDRPSLVQEYIWQEYDLAPEYPKLLGFLSFWDRTLEGPIRHVEVAGIRLITPAEIRHAVIVRH